jgi:hypothetical protein
MVMVCPLEVCTLASEYNTYLVLHMVLLAAQTRWVIALFSRAEQDKVWEFQVAYESAPQHWYAPVPVAWPADGDARKLLQCWCCWLLTPAHQTGS